MRRWSGWSLALGMLLAGGGTASWAEEDAARKFSIRQGLPPGEVLKLVGEPSAKYQDGDEECWLYGDALRESGGRRTCPELLFRNGRFQQTNWLPEDVMRRSVEVARSFGDWQPPAKASRKPFTARDTAVVGLTRDEVEGKLGRADAKKVFNGNEVWVYRKVPLSADEERELTVYVTFEDGKATRSDGN